MDSRDIQRLATRVKEQINPVSGAGSHFQQLAQEVSLRQRITDDSIKEIQSQVEELNKVSSETKTSISDHEKTLNTNTYDIDLIKDQIGILKNCIVDLQKRNQFLEDLNASLINQLKVLVEGLSNSALEEQNVMKEVISEILSRLSTNRTAPYRGRRSGRSSPVESINKRYLRKNSFEIKQKTTENAQETNPEKAPESESSSCTSNSSNPNKVTESELSLQANNDHTLHLSPDAGNIKDLGKNPVVVDADLHNEPLIYHVSEKHGDTGSKALRINMAPTNSTETLNTDLRKSFYSSFNNLSNQTKPKRKRTGSGSSLTNSLMRLDVLESLDETDWPDTNKLLEEISDIEKQTVNPTGKENFKESSNSSNEHIRNVNVSNIATIATDNKHLHSNNNNLNQTESSKNNDSPLCSIERVSDEIDLGVKLELEPTISQNGCSSLESQKLPLIEKIPQTSGNSSVLAEPSYEEMTKSTINNQTNHSLDNETSNSKKRNKKKKSKNKSLNHPPVSSGTNKNSDIKDQVQNEKIKDLNKVENGVKTTSNNVISSNSSEINLNKRTADSSGEQSKCDHKPAEEKNDSYAIGNKLSENEERVKKNLSCGVSYNELLQSDDESKNQPASEVFDENFCRDKINCEFGSTMNTTETNVEKQFSLENTSITCTEENKNGVTKNLEKGKDPQKKKLDNCSIRDNVSVEINSVKMEDSAKIEEGACAKKSSTLEESPLNDDRVPGSENTSNLDCITFPKRDKSTSCSDAGEKEDAESTCSTNSCATESSAILSPDAKEFEPTRVYGQAKLQLSPEESKELSSKAKCPKLVNTRMDEKVDNKKDTSTDQKDLKGSCVQCGSACSQRCANCHQVFYCKRECQREHWKAGHKNNCKPFKIEKSFTLGRYMVATRDFKAGDVIFKEDPLLIGPKQITEPVCLGCYKRVNGSYRCSKCTWPLCGPACESLPDHQPECVVGKEIGSPIDIQDFNDTNHFYEVVTTLRALTLKKKAPKKYAELLTLESHFNDRKGSDIYKANQKRVVNMLRNYFMLVDFPADDIDASEGSIHQMTGIIDVNGVDISLAESEICGIYPTYSLIEHSCTPNTKYKISSNRQLILKAAVDIREGENLSTIYTHMLWGTAARRHHLKSTRYFMCTCRRCADPTELGTHFSALRCQKCPLGFLMSAAPLDQLADWICTSCNGTITADEANDITLRLGEDVEKVLASAKIKELEEFIERSSSTVVHPNHFHLFAAKHSLLQMIGRGYSGLDDDAVKKKEKLCQEFLKTCTALDPGMSKLASFAGVALYEYHLAVLARARRGPTEQQVDKDALRKDLDTAKALLQQCIKVLQDEPDDKPETQLKHIAQENLIELSQWSSP